MAKMKQLATELAEWEPEIEELLERVEETLEMVLGRSNLKVPTIYEAFAAGHMSDEDKRSYLRNFTTDEDLIGLTMVYIDLKS